MRRGLWQRLARLEDRQLEAARLDLARIAAEHEACAAELARTRERWREALVAPADPVLLPIADPWAARLAARIAALGERLRELGAEEACAVARVSEHLARRDSWCRLAERAAEAEREHAARSAQAALDDLAALRSAHGQQSGPGPPSPAG